MADIGMDKISQGTMFVNRFIKSLDLVVVHIKRAVTS
jgi:hypothetical protein